MPGFGPRRDPGPLLVQLDQKSRLHYPGRHRGERVQHLRIETPWRGQLFENHVSVLRAGDFHSQFE